MIFAIRSLFVGGAVSAALLAVCVIGCHKPQPQAGIHYAEQKTAQDAGWQLGADKPPTPKTLLAMAKVLLAEDRESQAGVILQRVIQQAPNFLEARLDLAGIYMRQQQPGAAVEVLSAGLKIAPNDPVLLNDLGVAYLALHEPAKALPMFEQAAAAAPAPRQARYQSNLALSLALLGRYDEALTAYERVVGPAEAHHNVAVICESRNDTQRATAEQAKAVLAQIRGRSGPSASHNSKTAALPAAATLPAAAAAPASDGPAGSPAGAMMPASIGAAAGAAVTIQPARPEPLAETPIRQTQPVTDVPAPQSQPIAEEPAPQAQPAVEAPAAQSQPVAEETAPQAQPVAEGTDTQVQPAAQAAENGSMRACTSAPAAVEPAPDAQSTADAALFWWPEVTGP